MGASTTYGLKIRVGKRKEAGAYFKVKYEYGGSVTQVMNIVSSRVISVYATPYLEEDGSLGMGIHREAFSG
jgi:hypothetical protein